MVLSSSFLLAHLLRFDWVLPPQAAERLPFALPVTVALQFGVLWAFGLRRYSWRFVGLRESLRLASTLALATGVLVVVRTTAQATGWHWLEPMMLPWGVIAMDLAIAFLGVTGIRVAARLRAERASRGQVQPKNGTAVRTLLIGAGQAGVMVARELENRPELNLLPVGFVDDDSLRHGQVVQGLRVLGPTTKLKELALKHGAKQVLITIASAPRSRLRGIVKFCEEAGLAVKVVPGLFEMVAGGGTFSAIRDVAIEDLLGREAVELDLQAIAEDLRDRVVLVTGAGGSIGSELCRQIAAFQPKRLVLVEQAENALFLIHRELTAKFPELPIVPRIADVCEAQRMLAVFQEHRPEAVFHAAAHKHVPMMEWNPGEALKNNVRGTRMVADMSHAHGVRQFVLISTDKAVNPTSVMGATKRVAEMYVQALAKQSPTRFVTVRFGNVLGSNGSVIPIFREQLQQGGPITVTHPEMRRYFMTIPEACQLVLQAGSMGQGGEIFVLDMGEPVKIVDLAKDLIRLSGLSPYEDVDIVFSGIRPGEKLYEELSTEEEQAAKTRHPKIFIGKVEPAPLARVAAQVDGLLEAADHGTPAALRALIGQVVPEYTGEDAQEKAAPRKTG